MRAARCGVAVALAASCAACALLVGIESPTPRPDDANVDANANEGGGGDAATDAIVDAALDGAPPCTPAQALCGGACVDLLTDPMNCGACAQTCGTNSCVAGRCVTPYYLAPNGNDSADGTSPAKAWLTFQHAFRILEPGTALVLIDGTYTKSVNGMATIDCTSGGAHSGNADAGPIVLAAQHERAAVLASDGSQPAIGVYNCSGWVISGLTATIADFAFDAGTAVPHTVNVIGASRIELRGLLVDHNNRYFAANAINVQSVSDSLVVDSEIYDFGASGLLVQSGSNIDVRRVYVNSRGAADIDGGFASGDPTQGDNGTLLSPVGTNIVLENVLSEGVSIGHDVAGNGSGPVFFLGSIALGGAYGIRVYTGGLSTSVRDCVVANTSKSGLEFDYAANGPVSNVTAVQTNGIYLFGSGGVVANTDSVYGTGTGIEIGNGSPWSVEYSNSAGNPVDYKSPDAGELQNCLSKPPPTVGFGTNECIVYVLPTSNLIDAGEGGGPIGANIIYRYEDGGLTTTKLWDSHGAFPCGAVFPGINDVADASCQSVGARLNFVPGGCPAP